jgi:hypothetical protein
VNIGADFMLPKPEHAKAHRSELLRYPSVPICIAVQFRSPVCAVCPWKSDAALRARMPKAAIDEDRHLRFREEEIRTSR